MDNAIHWINQNQYDDVIHNVPLAWRMLRWKSWRPGLFYEQTTMVTYPEGSTVIFIAFDVSWKGPIYFNTFKFFEPPERLTSGCYFRVSGAWCPCWKKPKLSLIRALNWSKIRNLLWCNFVHFKVQSCTGVTFLVVVCGNSNEKDTDKQAKRRN